jgi:dihydrofolate reductase
MNGFSLVVAADLKRGIGKNQTLPWKLPGDMNYFKTLTSQTNDDKRRNAVIMGRKTWESIPPRFRPLKDRLNIVMSRDSNFALPEGVIGVTNLEQALDAAKCADVENCFVIGGGAVYAEALKHQACKRIFLTQVNAVFDCDTFLEDYEQLFEEQSASDALDENGIEYRFKVYARKGG